MSIASYRENVRKRAAGPHLPVCYPAAKEQVSTNYGYTPDVYREYRDFINRWEGTTHKDKQSWEYVEDEIDIYDKLARPLGGLSWEDMIWKRVNTELGFLRAANYFLREEYGVVVDLTYSGPTTAGVHSVGILPTPEAGHVVLVSTHVHRKLQGVVTLHQVAKHLACAPDRHIPDYPFHDANMVAIPPVN